MTSYNKGVIESPLKWFLISYTNNWPSERVYFSSSICRAGNAKGMVFIYGGRDSNKRSLSDLWGLRKHRDNSFDWIFAPAKGKYQPTSRYLVKF